jgi:TPR repeat protein
MKKTLFVLLVFFAWNDSLAQNLEREVHSGQSSAFAKAKGAIEARRYEEAVRLLRPLAANGDGQASLVLGELYYRGLGVQSDPTSAVDYYESAIRHGQSAAKVRLAEVLLRMDLVIGDRIRAKALLDERSQSGDLDAKLQLAKYLLGGGEIDGDKDRGVALLESILSSDRQLRVDYSSAVLNALALLSKVTSVPLGQLTSKYGLAELRMAASTDSKVSPDAFLLTQLRNANTVSEERAKLIESQAKRLAQLEAERRELKTALNTSVLPEYKKLKVSALIIGNGDYARPWQLRNPVNDAKLISATLRKLNVLVTYHENLNRERLVQALSDFERSSKESDISIFYYAGHGVQLFGQNYLLPIDTNMRDIGQATLQGVSISALVENYMSTPIKLAFFDACRENPLMTSQTRGAKRGLAPMEAGEGTLISFATKDGGLASDGEGRKNSPYTAALAQHLNDPVDIAVVLRSVRESVMNETGKRQIPWEYGSLTGGELILSRISPK